MPTSSRMTSEAGQPVLGELAQQFVVECRRACPLVEVSRSRASRTRWAARRRFAGGASSGTAVEADSRGSLEVTGDSLHASKIQAKMAQNP